MRIIIILLALLTLSCSTVKTTQERTNEGFDTYVQELRYERDVYRTALEECKGN